MKPEEAAFPIEDFDLTHAEGLSKREWFAGRAMAGLFACPSVHDSLDAACESDPQTVAQACAGLAVLYADALLAALSK